MKIALCLICRPDNKEAKNLARCLSSIYKFVDNIFITITAKSPSERTRELEAVCKEYHAKVSWFEWNDDFAEARRFNFNQVPEDFTHIIWLDSDDVLKGGEKLRELCELMKGDFIICDYLYDFDEKGLCVVRHMKTRIIKNNGSLKWDGLMLHEDLQPTREVVGDYTKDIEVYHLKDKDEKESVKERNLRISEKALKKYPKDPRAYWNYANSLWGVGRLEEARKNYLIFLKMSNSEEERYLAWLRMAECFWGEGKINEAIEASLESLALRPWYPDAYFALGKYYYHARKWEHAKTFLLQGLAFPIPKYQIIVYNPRDYDFVPLQMLGWTYMNLNKLKEAKDCFEQCLKIYPGHEQITKIVEFIKKELTELEQLDKILEQAKTIEKKEVLKDFLDSLPDKYKAHPKVCHLRNISFIKETSSGREIDIFCGSTSFEWDGNSTAVGGSEEAIINLSKIWARLGWQVTVYNSCGYQEKIINGVKWKPFWTFNARDKRDILIVWRHPLLFDHELNATVKLLDMHDVLPSAEFTRERIANIDKIMVKSKAQRELWKHIPDKKFEIISNGIDLSHFKGSQKNLKMLLNTSSPDRGLLTLLKLFPEIRKKVPDVELHWYYGWKVYDMVHEGNAEKMAEKEEILKLLQQPRVFYADEMLSHEEIAKKYEQAAILVYPTEFFEINFISGLKAQYAGCYPITTTVGALPETIKWGKLIDCKDIYTNRAKQKEWVNAVVKVLKKPLKPDLRVKRHIIENYSWEKIAKSWDKIFNKLLKEKHV